MHHLVLLLMLLCQQPGGLNWVNSSTSFEATLIGCDGSDVFHDFQDVPDTLG